MYDFFVSHSSKDKDNIVEEIVATLQNMGYKVWYDKNEILVSDDISAEIKKGLSSSYCIILIVTNNFMASNWTFYETGAFDTSKRNCIIPLLYNVSNNNKHKLLNIIGNRKYLDMSIITKETAASELVKILRRTQEENKDLNVIESLQDTQKRLASYETVNSEIISLKLREYLNLLDTHKEYLIKKKKIIVKTATKDLLKQKGIIINRDIDKDELLKLLEKHSIGSVNVREYIEFLLSQNSENYVNDYISIINHALLNILTYYIHTRYPSKLSFEQIQVASPEALTYSDFEDMFEIDKKVMREDLIANVKTTYDWFQYNKYTHIGVRDIASKKIVGYFSVLPVTEETYSQIVSGNFMDKEFTSDNIKQYIFSDFYRVYVAGVGIDPKYQNTGAFIMLYNAFIDLIITLAKEREIYISEILAEASTRQGEKFCKMVGMKKISSTNSETDIYKLVTIPPEFRHTSKKGKELYNLCKSKFEEYRDYFENE